MAITKEIWANHIVEELFADNSFLSKSVNHDEYVLGGRTVHIPNAGNPSKVVKNRTQLPATVEKRADMVVSYDLDVYTTDPVYISNAESVELSYDKRASVLRGDKLALQDSVAEDMLIHWAPSASGILIPTSGEDVEAHTDGGTGTRKSLTKADIHKAALQFNRQNIPQKGRYLLLDADMYAQLLDSMTDHQAQAFHSQADLSRGTIGNLYGFDSYMRSTALVYGTDKHVKSGKTRKGNTNLAGALAWHESYVCRALGEVKSLERLDDPTYYGDIYSFLVRAGGRKMHTNGLGVLAIVQGTDTRSASSSSMYTGL